MKAITRRSCVGLGITSLLLGTSACQSSYSAETKMTPVANLSPYLQNLFLKTRPLCWSRYVIDIPENATVTFFDQQVGMVIKTLPNQAANIAQLAKAEFDAKLKASWNNLVNKYDEIHKPELIDIKQGPVQHSVRLEYFPSQYYKKDNSPTIVVFVASGGHAFRFKDEVSPLKSDDSALSTVNARLNDLASSVRAIKDYEIPTDPGIGIEKGFIAESTGQYQELFNIGVDFPDITEPSDGMSLASNKQADYQDFEQVKAANIDSMGGLFSSLRFMRDDKRVIGTWTGNEYLTVNTAASSQDPRAHDFGWVATHPDRSTPHPSWLSVKYTDTIAPSTGKPPLTDDDAVHLFERILSTLRFRVPPPPV